MGRLYVGTLTGEIEIMDLEVFKRNALPKNKIGWQNLENIDWSYFMGL